MHQDDAPLVPVFTTDDPAVLPLATMALDAEGIDYVVKSAGKADTMQWAMSQTPTIRPVVMEIVVTGDVAARARDVVADLERPLSAGALPEPAAVAESFEPPTVHLENATTGASIGTITEAQLQSLASHLEEDAPQQYILNAEALQTLREAHADAPLVALLKGATDPDRDLVIRWVVR